MKDSNAASTVASCGSPRGSEATARPFVRIVRGVMLGVVTCVVGAYGTAAVSQSNSEPIQPVPQYLKHDPVRAAIGRRLFSDVRLSGNDKVSCASCHDLAKGGSNGQVHATGLGGVATTVNVPTLFNAALNFRQFWNGRAESLEEQIDEVVQNPKEMGATWDQIVKKVSADAQYRSAFGTAYKEGVTRQNIEDALASFERTLVTPNARFDNYLRGDAGAITTIERSGYEKFKRYGCVSCHQGVNVGGNMFQKFGVMGDYFAARGHPTDADLGRFQVTHEERDKYVFKVPTLRNVELTAPYFHDGSAATLEAAVDIMFRYQLGRVGTDRDKKEIVAFLKTLTGDREPRP